MGAVRVRADSPQGKYGSVDAARQRLSQRSGEQVSDSSDGGGVPNLKTNFTQES